MSDVFFLEWRDPLFGLIIFFALLFIISSLSYWWGRRQRYLQKGDLQRFVKLFATSQESSVPQGEALYAQLAQCYEHQGDYPKSVELYHQLLLEAHEPQWLLALARNYFKAGFLERARQSLLQLLKATPRNEEALILLILIYERLDHVNKIDEVLESLEYLNPLRARVERSYLEIRTLIREHTDPVVCAPWLIDHYERHHQMGGMIFEWLLLHAPHQAWRHWESALGEVLSDRLWDVEELDLAIIAQEPYLCELFSARGDVALAQEARVMELDLLIHLGAEAKVELSFEYRCRACHHLSLFPFHRCGVCHTLDTRMVEMSLRPKRIYETYHPFE